MEKQMKIPDPMHFHLSVTWSEEDEVFYARCIDIPACIGQGDDVKEAVDSAREAIKDHLEYRAELGLEMPLPGGKE
jgi:predicted RNase H-like HicB family nuclease